MRSLCLASTSPYRRELLQRLGLSFDVARPDCDETPLDGESPRDLVLRLARGKAASVARTHPQSLIIGSDQVAVLDQHVLGKPGETSRAVEQLRMASGQTVSFVTGLCLLDAASGADQADVVRFDVRFRELSDAEIRRYVQREQPLDCAGSFKSEGLGVSLFESMHGEDPNALIGLPLIRLCAMLRSHGFDLP